MKHLFPQGPRLLHVCFQCDQPGHHQWWAYPLQTIKIMFSGNNVGCMMYIPHFLYYISKLMKFVGSQSENKNDNTFYLPKILHAHHLSWFIFRVFFYEVPFAPSSKTAPRPSLLFLLLEAFLRHQSPPISPRLGIKASKPWWKHRPPSGVGITPPRYMCIKCRSKHIRKHHLNWKKGSWFLPFPVFSSIFIFVKSSWPGKKNSS